MRIEQIERNALQYCHPQTRVKLDAPSTRPDRVDEHNGIMLRCIVPNVIR